MSKPTVQTHGLRGHASVFGIKDSAGTTVDPGAFLRSIAFGEMPKLGAQHALHLNVLGTSLPVGVVTLLEEDQIGLRFEAKFHDTQAGREILEAVNDGSMRGVSFAFDLETADGYTDRAGVLHFTRLDLLELGPVAYPANRAATCEVYELPTDEPAAGAVEPAEMRSADDQEANKLRALIQWAAKEIRR